MTGGRETEIRSLLPKPPLPLGGRLGFETGKAYFVELPYHEGLVKLVKARAAARASMWFFAGPVGSGKTWTLSWLARKIRAETFELKGKSRWEVVLVPGLSFGAGPRTLIEAVFAASEHLRVQLATEKGNIELGKQGQPSHELVKAGIGNNEVWSVFTGNRGTFPRMGSVPSPPKWTSTETQESCLAEWFRVINQSGVGRLVILLDEFEMVITTLSPRQLRGFSNALRKIYDMIEGDNEMPNVQFVLGATTDVVTSLRPTDGRGRTAQGWIEALRSRMSEPFYIRALTEEQALAIAEQAIGRARSEKLGVRFIPYDEDAVVFAYAVSHGNVRRFAGMLRQMWEDAFLEDAKRITKQHAEGAAERLGLSAPSE